MMSAVEAEGDGRLLLAESDVTRLVEDEYGFSVSEQRLLGGEVDQNVWIAAEDGREFLLKASRGESDTDVAWQQALLDHLKAHGGDIPVPRTVPTRRGETVFRAEVSGRAVVVRLLTWLPGRMLAEADGVTREVLVQLGGLAARLTQSLAGLGPDTVPHSHYWDIRRSGDAVEQALPYVLDEDDRRCVELLMAQFDRVRPLLPSLPEGVVHQDLNDFNVLVSRDGAGELAISGILDVNDSLFTIRVAELAIAVAYAMLRRDDPLDAAAAVVSGFHAVIALTDDEIRTVFPLAVARLCVNATTWTRRTADAHHPYGNDRMRHTWPMLRKLSGISPAVAEVRFRRSCGLEPRTTNRDEWRRTMTGAGRIAVLDGEESYHEVDLSPAGDFWDGVDWTDAEGVARRLASTLADGSPGARGFVRHLTASMLQAGQRQPGVDDVETVQLGLVLFATEGEPVRSPLDGVVVQTSASGPLVLEHRSAGNDGSAFWTCWRGVDAHLEVGTSLNAGDGLGVVTTPASDAGLGAIVQLQVFHDEALVDVPPPPRARPDEVDDWAKLVSDPADLLGLPDRAAAAANWDAGTVISVRDQRLARSQRAYWKRPPNLVRGRGVWLYDEHGRGYLDAINNVTHVGHAEPRITRAAASQMSKLNTNSRFLYPGIAAYAERLVSTLPAPLEVVFLVCTGSEANDLALRMARQVTGRQDVLVIDGAYHGNTAAVMGISPNRYKGPGGRGAPSTTHEVIRPDVYRGNYGRNDPEAGGKYAADVGAVVERLVTEGRPPAAFIAESLMGTAGNVVFPAGYLQAGFASVRAAGGLCISDEVQVGVGRLGTHFWGFEAQDVVPDIVTMGKPLGNGHPIAAVVTTREIADAFDDGVKYFNTFGGNPVSCAVGMTVLDIVQGDGLQQRAHEVGGYFLKALEELKAKHPIIGDVRGHGLYLGIELVRDRDTKEPAVAEALSLSEQMKDHGVIVYPTGAFDNVMKLKPPMVFGEQDVDLFVSTMDEVVSKNPWG